MKGDVISILIGIIGALFGVIGIGSALRSSSAKKAAEKRAEIAEKAVMDNIERGHRTIKETTDAHNEVEQIAEERKEAESPASAAPADPAGKLDRLRQ